VPLRGVGAAACSGGRAQTLEFVHPATLLRAVSLDEQAALSWDEMTSRLHKPARKIVWRLKSTLVLNRKYTANGNLGGGNFLWPILWLPLEREHSIRGSEYIFQNLHYIESALRSICGCLIS